MSELTPEILALYEHCSAFVGCGNCPDPKHCQDYPEPSEMKESLLSHHHARATRLDAENAAISATNAALLEACEMVVMYLEDRNISGRHTAMIDELMSAIRLAKEGRS